MVETLAVLCALFFLVILRVCHTSNRALRALVLELARQDWVGIEDVRELAGYHVTRWQFILLVKQLEREGLVESRPWPVLVGSRQYSTRKCRRHPLAGR